MGPREARGQCTPRRRRPPWQEVQTRQRAAQLRQEDASSHIPCHCLPSVEEKQESSPAKRRPVFVKILLRGSESEAFAVRCHQRKEQLGALLESLQQPSLTLPTTIGWSFHHIGGEQRGLSFFKFGVKLFFS